MHKLQADQGDVVLEDLGLGLPSLLLPGTLEGGSLKECSESEVLSNPSDPSSPFSWDLLSTQTP